MKANLGYIAVGIYILITLFLILMPRKWLKPTLKRDFALTDAEFKRKDIIGYYRILFMVGGFATIIIVLILKYI